MIIHKEARRDFDISDTFKAGVMLTGAEVKSLREGRGNMKSSHAKVIGTELYLLGVDIPKYTHYSGREYDSKRTRKLLMKRTEIEKIREKMEGKSLALIPLRLYFSGRWAKVELGLGRGKKEYEKRADIKKRDIQREVERDFKKSIK